MIFSAIHGTNESWDEPTTHDRENMMTNLELALIAALKQIESECELEIDNFWKVFMIRKSVANALNDLPQEGQCNE